MRRTSMILGGLLLFGAGYVLGTADVSLTRVARAQNPAGGEEGLGIQLAEDTMIKIQDAKLALQDAMDALQNEGRYESITDGINSFLILSGGGDALGDLESGHGVDPETFAALYAGHAIPEIGDHLAKDDQGRLTYKGKVVRMYSESRLQQSFATRMRLANPGL